VNLKAKLKLSIDCQVGKRYSTYVRANIAKAHVLLSSPLRELSVALVGDLKMSQLHKQFMGIPGPTDVLTFPLEKDAGGRDLAGEVIVCVPEAERQARVAGTLARDEVLLYTLHGLLHLSGFDDRTRSGFRKMHRKEDEILSLLGIGPVFNPDDKPTAKAKSSRRMRTARQTKRAARKAGEH